MADLIGWQLALVALIFIWSGFVRSGLGFGGAALSLPFLLLVNNNPLIFLPIISIQLMVFSSWIAWRGHRQAKRLNPDSNETNVDWGYLKRSMTVIIIPKILGVLGLLTMPSNVVSAIIFGMICVLAVSYIVNRPFRSTSRWTDMMFLVLGGYFSGTSLIGAPLIVAVYASHVKRSQLRDTLFVLWFILVSIKMLSFVIAGVDLQWVHQLWLFPCALAGHIIGQKFHEYIQTQSNEVFFRVIGIALLLVCITGLLTNLL